MNFYFLDIETNSNSLEFNKDEQEIIQIGIYNPKTKEKFNRNINIGKPLSENIKRLTGITDSDISNGTNITTALNDTLNFLGNPKETIIVGHNIEDFDLYILGKNDKRFLEYNYIDTLHLSLFLFPGYNSYTVQDLYKKFIKTEYAEKHQALQDAIDECELFYKIFDTDFLSKYYEKNSKDLSFVKNLINKYDGGLKDNCHDFKFLEKIISNIELKEYVGLKSKVLKKWFYNYEPENSKSLNEIIKPTEYNTIKISDKGMENSYKDFINNNKSDFRDAQYSMAQHIKNVFNGDNKNLFIEAGTGTGKTYGYLLPAIEFIKKNTGNKKLKIFIATYTKVLQNQIMEKDVPTLNKYYPNIKFELLKASTEGIALDNVPFKGQLTFRDLALRNRLYRGNFYLSDIHFSLQLKIGHNKLEGYLPGDGEEKGLDETYGFRGKLEHQLNNGNIFIINQAFLITRFNPISKNKFTGIIEPREIASINISDKYDAYCVIDEGHNLESVTREFLTLDYTKNQFNKVLNIFNSTSNFNIITYLNKCIEHAKNVLDNLIDEEAIKRKKLEIGEIEKKIKELEGLPNLKEINEIKILNKEISEIEADIETLTSNTKITSKKDEIKQLESIKKLLTKRIISEDNKNIFKIYNRFLNDFPNTRLCKLAIDDITNLRNQGYDTSIAEYDKNTFNNLYLSNCFTDFLSFSYQIIQKLYNEISESIKEETRYVKNFVFGFLKYFKIGLILISDYESKEYFFDSIVEIEEGGYDIKNFGFKGIPLSLELGTKFLDYSLGNIVLSATLFDKGTESYVLKKVFGTDYNTAKIKKYPTPFNYIKQRKIYTIKQSNTSDGEKENIMHKFIEKYGGRTLILTTTLAQKRKIANLCKNKYEKIGIMVLMHKSGTLASSTNQKNVQSLRENPNTILIGSKSYAEGVDVPGENLKLVIIDKLPFLPPTPFIKFQDKKRRNKGDKYVYKFLCSIDFRQSIGRLIRTITDTGDILILDERILQPSGQFFRDYLEGEEINETT